MRCVRDEVAGQVVVEGEVRRSEESISQKINRPSAAWRAGLCGARSAQLRTAVCALRCSSRNSTTNRHIPYILVFAPVFRDQQKDDFIPPFIRGLYARAKRGSCCLVLEKTRVTFSI